jgi:hypothetical protein
MGFISVNAASAAQEINHADGKEKIGVVSASNAYTLDELSMRFLVRLMSKVQRHSKSCPRREITGYTELLKSINESLASCKGCVINLLL